MKLIISLSLLFISSLSQAAQLDFTANLSGLNEPPTPNASPGTGFANVIFDDVLNTLRVEVTFSGLEGPTTASHIHAPTAAPFTGSAGVATTTPYFTGFPIGVTSGTYDHTLDLTSTSSYNPAFVTAHGGTPAGAEAALIAAMEAGESYLNIHTTVFPGGEISGYLVEAPVPESGSTMSLLAPTLLALFALPRRSRLRVAQ